MQIGFFQSKSLVIKEVQRILKHNKENICTQERTRENFQSIYQKTIFQKTGKNTSKSNNAFSLYHSLRHKMNTNNQKFGQMKDVQIVFKKTGLRSCSEKKVHFVKHILYECYTSQLPALRGHHWMGNNQPPPVTNTSNIFLHKRNRQKMHTNQQK
eukprot:TRINITY_DN6052_c0_g2_i1.p1 TRINITY_DN6052_c0_g2~~TRINITY_DN6052_c0_g2_i1.p1  ORF type:complete len:155 (+),score=3.81 TRINITY_DN6052_c0_g2_i1:297-761(+)